MIRTLIAWTLLIAMIAVGAHVSASDSPPKASKAAAAPVAAGGGTNLQVLPKDTSQAEILDLMAHYTQELGVECTFCHAQNAQTQLVDFASDENPMKQVARIMIGMVHDINHNYLAQVGDRRYARPISCGNCHQGQTYPPEFDPSRLR